MVGVAGCGPSEADARAYLKDQGFDVTELRKNGKAFEFTAKKDQDICTGAVTITKGFGSSSSSMTSSCKRDLSACKPGASEACMNLADELYDQDPKVFPEAAVELYRIACDDKAARACTRAGEYEVIDKNWDEMRRYSKLGCDLGDGEGCSRLAKAALLGEGEEKNPDHARELFQTACEKGSLRGCRSFVGLVLDAKSPDVKGALASAKKICDVKFDDGCAVYGIGLFMDKNYTEALTILEAACRDTASGKLQGRACNTAAAILVDGMGMAKDATRAIPLFEAGCEAKEALACSNLARNYEKGNGVPQADAAKAKEYRAKACELGHQASCSR